MSQSLPIDFTLRASEQVVEAGRWWLEHRSKAPDALHEELQQVLQLIATQPGVGAIARNVKLAGVRRILLRRIGYHLYYRLRDSPAASLQVVAFWHASRGHVPRL